ncbi:MAG: hypothetical protein ACYDHN_02415 [Solirubrobacteraceae bacterium]
MSETAQSFEGLLREALAPVEPPDDLAARLESTLTSITAMAADELEAWELSAMRDPRNWARPAAAVVAGSAAGAALVLLRARRRARASGPGLDSVLDTAEGVRDTAERALRELGRETRRLFGER